MTLSTPINIMTTPKLEQSDSSGSPTPTCCASWIPGDKPDTPKGSSTTLWVTTRHKESGKIGVGRMTYLNSHVMPVSNDCDPPDCAVPHDPDDDGWCEEYEGRAGQTATASTAKPNGCGAVTTWKLSPTPSRPPLRHFCTTLKSSHDDRQRQPATVHAF